MSVDDNSANQAQQPENHAPLATVPVEVVDPPGNTATKRKRKPMSRFECAMLLLTIIAIAVAVGTGVVFYLQFREMTRQTKLLSEQAAQAARDSETASRQVEKQLGISQTQAEAAQDSVTATTKQMRQDQRAWIKASVTMQPFGVIVPAGAKIHVVNTGKTPANNVSAHIVVKKIINGKQPVFSYSFHPPHNLYFFPATFPNEPSDLEAWMYTEESHDPLNPPKITEADMKELMGGKAYMVVYGKFTFKDIFGVKHWLKFCTYSALAKGGYTAQKCTEYNTQDNN